MCSLKGRYPYIKFSGTRKNSRLTSGSMLVRSELRDVERSAERSGHYWRRIICKNVSFWK
jgi:hypothetical protein